MTKIQRNYEMDKPDIGEFEAPLFLSLFTNSPWKAFTLEMKTLPINLHGYAGSGQGGLILECGIGKEARQFRYRFA